MSDDLIRCMIWAVIESFPIDEAKKEDMLRSMAGSNQNTEDVSKKDETKGAESDNTLAEEFEDVKNNKIS